MNKVGAKIILWLLILTLLGFTVVRTLHFLSLTFPPDQQYVAYLALVAFDVGILGWLSFASHAAEGAVQRAVAYGMIFVCCAGVVITTIADMLMVSAKNGITNKLPPDVATVALWAVMLVIALNVVAGVIAHLVDPKHQRHMAQERARDKIHAATMAEIDAQAAVIAPQIAAQVATHWATVTVTEMAGLLPKGEHLKISAPASGENGSGLKKK